MWRVQPSRLTLYFTLLQNNAVFWDEASVNSSNDNASLNGSPLRQIKFTHDASPTNYSLGEEKKDGNDGRVLSRERVHKEELSIYTESPTKPSLVQSPQDTTPVRAKSIYDESSPDLLNDSAPPSTEPHFAAGAGGYQVVAGVHIAKALVKSGEDTAGRTLAGVPPQDLLCEECGVNTATMYAEHESELLCDGCTRLLYLPSSGGVQHIDIEEGRVRRLLGSDVDRLYSTVVRTVGGMVASIPDYEVDEEELAKIRGFDASEPSAIEAPRINLVKVSALEAQQGARRGSVGGGSVKCPTNTV